VSLLLPSSLLSSALPLPKTSVTICPRPVPVEMSSFTLYQLLMKGTVVTNITNIEPAYFLLRGLSEGNARGINFIFFLAFSHKTQFNYNACVKCKPMCVMNPRAHGLKQRPPLWTIDVSERYSMAIAFNIHTKSHTVRGRHTLKPCGAFWERVGRRTNQKSIYERPLRVRLSIEKYQAKPASIKRAETVYLEVIENTVEYQKLL